MTAIEMPTAAVTAIWRAVLRRMWCPISRRPARRLLRSCALRKELPNASGSALAPYIGWARRARAASSTTAEGSSPEEAWPYGVRSVSGAGPDTSGTGDAEPSANAPPWWPPLRARGDTPPGGGHARAVRASEARSEPSGSGGAVGCRAGGWVGWRAGGANAALAAPLDPAAGGPASPRARASSSSLSE